MQVAVPLPSALTSSKKQQRTTTPTRVKHRVVRAGGGIVSSRASHPIIDIPSSKPSLFSAFLCFLLRVPPRQTRATRAAGGGVSRLLLRSLRVGSSKGSRVSSVFAAAASGEPHQREGGAEEGSLGGAAGSMSRSWCKGEDNKQAEMNVIIPNSGTNAEAITTKQTKKKKPVDKDPNWPKNKRRAYALFVKAVYPELRASDPSLSFGEINRAIATRWREMDAIERRNYRWMADQDKMRYERELANYQKELLGENEKTDQEEEEESKKEEHVEKKPMMAMEEEKKPGVQSQGGGERRRDGPDGLVKPRPNRSAYALFLQSNYPKVRAHDPELSLGEVNEQLARQWRNAVSEATRAEYESAAEKDRERYVQEMAAHATAALRETRGKDNKDGKQDEQGGGDGGETSAAAASADSSLDFFKEEEEEEEGDHHHNKKAGRGDDDHRLTAAMSELDASREDEDPYARVLAVFTEVLGDYRVDTSTAVQNIASVFNDAGDSSHRCYYYDRALETYKRFLAVFLADFRAGSPRDRRRDGRSSLRIAANVLDDMGAAYAREGRYPEALDALRGALELYLRVEGKDHPSTVLTMTHMATVYESLMTG